MTDKKAVVARGTDALGTRAKTDCEFVQSWLELSRVASHAGQLRHDGLALPRGAADGPARCDRRRRARGSRPRLARGAVRRRAGSTSCASNRCSPMRTASVTRASTLGDDQGEAGPESGQACQAHHPRGRGRLADQSRAVAPGPRDARDRSTREACASPSSSGCPGRT